MRKSRSRAKITGILPVDISIHKPNFFLYTPLTKSQWLRLYNIDGYEVLAKISQQIKPSKNISVIIEHYGKLPPEVKKNVIQRIRFEVGMDERMGSLHKIIKRDFNLKLAIDENPGFRIFANSNTDEMAIMAMLAEKMPLDDFIIAIHKLVRNFGRKWGDYRLFPNAETISKISYNEWLNLGITGKKAQYMNLLTQDTIEKFEIFAFYPIYQRGLKGLKQIQGISENIARSIMIYGARRYKKAIYSAELRDIIENVYNIRLRNFIEFDPWIEYYFPNDPALIMHTLLVHYMNEYERTLEYPDFQAIH